MKRSLAFVHAAVSWAFVATIVVQVFLAGAAIVNLGGNGNFATHADFGYTVVGLAALGTVLTAILAGGSRREAGFALGLLVVYFIQTTLPILRTDAPMIAALHPVNAMLLFGLATWYAVRATRRWRRLPDDAADAGYDVRPEGG
jgi:hypothetical protein